MSITSLTVNTPNSVSQHPLISHWIFLWSKYQWRIEGTSDSPNFSKNCIECSLHSLFCITVWTSKRSRWDLVSG